jgi:hypothetical protein
MYIYKFRACRFAVYLDFRERKGPDVYRRAVDPWWLQVFERFSRIIICFLFQFYLYHSNRAVIRARRRRRRAARMFTIAPDQHLSQLAHLARSRPIISSCCFFSQKSTPRFGPALCNFSHIASTVLHSLFSFLLLAIPSCLSSSSPSFHQLDLFGSHVNSMSKF